MAGLSAGKPHLVVMDGQLTDMTPADLCEALQRDGAACPVILLGAEPEQSDGLRAAGVSECIPKPFRFASLLQRVQAQLRDQSTDKAVQLGSYRLHPLARLMIDGAGRQVRLTEKETAILVYLHRAGTRVVPRDELLGEVWGYSNAATTHTVETHIYRLRRKLEAADGAKPLVCTENGGYRLAG